MTRDADVSVDPMLGQVFDPSVPIERRQDLLARLRQRRDFAPHVDRAVLLRDQAQSEAIAELTGIVDELRMMTTQLTRPPLHEGVFIGPCALADGRKLARVAAGGSRELLLELVDESILPTLAAGDRVVLGPERNVVLGRSDGVSTWPGECASVERWLGADRLVVRHRDQTIVTRAAASLANEVKPGDTVRLDAASGFAMERVEPQERNPYAPEEEATALPPDALAGYDDVRDGALRRITYAIAHPDLAALYAIRERRPWILLGGPPGVGKTTLARVIAGDLKRQTGRRCRIRKLNGSELFSPYVGETEARIRALVREFRQGDDCSIVFIDEAEAIARTRGTAGNVHADRFLNTLLAELEGFDGRAPCIVIAATNRLDMLDSAFRSRFSTEIEFARPRIDAGRAIFARHLPSDLPYDPGGDAAAASRAKLVEGALSRLYLPNAPGALLATLRFRDGKTRSVFTRDLISGRLIEQICVDARERAFQRHVEGHAPGLRIDDMDAAVDSVRERLRATLTAANAHDYLSDIPHDVGVVAVDPAPRMRGGVTFIHEAAR